MRAEGTKPSCLGPRPDQSRTAIGSRLFIFRFDDHSDGIAPTLLSAAELSKVLHDFMNPIIGIIRQYSNERLSSDQREMISAISTFANMLIQLFAKAATLAKSQNGLNPRDVKRLGRGGSPANKAYVWRSLFCFERV